MANLWEWKGKTLRMKSMASGDTSWKFGDEKSNWQFIVLAIVRYLLPECVKHIKWFWVELGVGFWCNNSWESFKTKGLLSPPAQKGATPPERSWKVVAPRLHISEAGEAWMQFITLTKWQFKIWSIFFNSPQGSCTQECRSWRWEPFPHFPSSAERSQSRWF